jgi:uncharacterized protein YjaG (DUF416 family)
MAYQFDPERLTQRLGDLIGPARLAFAALLLDRAIPNFFRFEYETGAPGGAVLRGAQAKVWALVEGSAATSIFKNLNSKACEAYAPDSERFESLYTSSALDAVSIACNVLDYILSEEIELLVDSASARRDSVDMYLQLSESVDSSAPDFEAQVVSHPLMQEELGFQDADLQFLEHCQRTKAPIWPDVLRRSVELRYSELRMTP